MPKDSTKQSGPLAKDIARLEDIGFLSSMLITLLGNYAQTGHFGGPLAYVPYVVTSHLIGPDAGGLRFDYRRPKHPYADKFMLAGGHNAPVTYALWMVMGEALARRYATTKTIATGPTHRPRSSPSMPSDFDEGKVLSTNF